MLVDQLLTEAAKKLDKTSDAATIDAERLLLHVLEKEETSWLHARGDLELTNKQEDQFNSLVEQRKSGMPLAYILGVQEFYGREFVVNKSVLIPRPQTEEIIDFTLNKLDSGYFSKPENTLTITDIGTGSGCIAITLALETKASIIATDTSLDAIETAKENAQKHSVIDKIEFKHGDLLEPILGRKVDLIVSNPPYVTTRELKEINPGDSSKSGLLHEPALALDGGVDGKKFTDQIIATKIPTIIEITGGTIELFNF